MSKRPSSPQPQNLKPPRKRAGFRVARSTAPKTTASSSNPSIFVTLHQPEEPTRPLIAHSKAFLTTSPNLSRPVTPNSGATTPTSSTSELTQSDLSIGPDFTGEPTNTDSPIMVEEPTKRKRERHTRNVDRLTEWLKFRKAFLDEALRHDGLGDFLGQDVCSACNKAPGQIKCRDCMNGGMLKCVQCTITLHQSLPLHRVERWNGEFFNKDSLQNLGLHYQLGHGSGLCPCPSSGPKNFVVFDTSGPHFVNIDYCNCAEDQQPAYTQLLREKWFPATLARPQTVFTFDCMETFHELTLQGKTSLYDYYNTLIRRYDNAGILKPINRYTEIHRVFRMWRNLMALKRAGRGHSPDGIEATPKGGLMVECPACPHPGRNLPVGWENAGELMFLYTLFVAVDANFKLKGKERNLSDVELMAGLGAFVEEEPYQAHIASHVDEEEITTCESQHDALVRAATRSSSGYAVSGAVAVICSRHCLIRKNGAGDLQKGEKYCNVDFVVFASLVGIALLRLVITYDIVCEWSKNYQKRLLDFPKEMHIPDTVRVDVAVPGWHINGHGEKCRNSFNLSYMEGVGRTVGEDIETTWAGTNLLAPSVREMGPAARHDTLNDHWNGWNFRKIVGFRQLFLKRFQEAFKMSAKQLETFEQMTSTFPVETVNVWESMVVKWTADPKAPNPYKEPKSATTVQDVRLELSKEEAVSLGMGPPRHKMTMPTFLLTGFEIQDSQYLLTREASQTKGLRTSKQLADLQEKRNALFRLILNWREVQLVYMPHVASLLSRTSSSEVQGTLAETVPLYLPSSLPQELRRLPELSEICNLESRLREPQASDALATIQRQRRIIQGLWQFKRLNASGVGNKPNTRMVSLYKRFEDKTKRATQEYRTAWRALGILNPNGTWSTYLKELKDTDIKGPGRDPEDMSNSRFEPSWIWLVPRVPGSTPVSEGNTENEFHDSMRVEWAKARARKNRWREEVLLVQEEMRRVLEYLRWRSRWWQEQASIRNHEDPTIVSGLSGYANKQAAICLGIGHQCALYWLPCLVKKGIKPLWASDWDVGKPVEVEDFGDETDNGNDDEDDEDVEIFDD